MMQTMKRSLAMFIVVIMFISLVPVFSIGVSAADDFYTYNGKYIYNWGTRVTVATFLSPNAEKFYNDNNTSYDELSAYSGSSTVSNVPSSQLYNVLQDLMESNHSYKNSYDASKEYFQYTDCENGGGQISSFYSGTKIGPGWGQGGSWNREHTWPNSKGLGGQDENDIMMLRPTSTSENSSRGNTAYGQGSNYYNPNSESGGKYNLHGDVARIFLYVYVRWGNRNYAWGTSGVMESVDVLLAWMEEDPVDTWELGRNDAVEAITGTRNVFVDYPELAFLLFNEEIPADMKTPSGEAAGANQKCGHNNYSAVVTAPTCTQRGYTTYTCQVAGCGYSYKDAYTDAPGHNYSNGVCSACGEAEPAVPTYVSQIEVGKAYKLGLLNGTEYYFTGSIVNKYYGSSDADYQKGVDVFLEQTTGGYYLYFTNSSGQKQYINLVASGTYRNFSIGSTATSVFVWNSAKSTISTTLEGETCYIGNYGSYTNMSGLSSSKLKDSDYIARLYTMGGNSGSTPSTPPTEDPSCQHNYTSVVTAPTCTAGGFTTYTCTLCNDSYTGNNTPAKGHSYTNGTCVNCGAVQSAPGASTQVTITFDASKTNRTEFSASKQVWSYNGLTVTNDKASAGNDVADYSNPVRFYAGSNVTIAYPGMTKIEINCASLGTKYVDSWLKVTGATATQSNGIVTVVFDTPQDSFTYTGLSAQSRAYSITVYAEAQSPNPPQQCTHTNTKIEGASAATCTTNGHTGATLCADCGETLNAGSVIPSTGHAFADWTQVTAPNCTTAGSERRDCNNCAHYETRTVEALGHNDANNDHSCDLCGEQLVVCQHTNTKVEGASAATCTTDGHTGATRCLDCNVVINTGTIIPAAGHKEVAHDGKAATCLEKGWAAYVTCENCNYSTYAEIPAAGHKEVTHSGKTATCLEKGWAAYVTCENCDYTTYTEIAAIGHVYAEWVTVRTPNCTTEGLERKDCDKCSEYETRAIEALGHNDADNNGICDTCEAELAKDEPTTPDASEKAEHICEEEASGWKKFWTSIMNFFRRLFGQPELCACGEEINKED